MTAYSVVRIDIKDAEEYAKYAEIATRAIKKFGGELVKPGNIIVRQRGTKWWPGDNVGLGKDHTIFSTEHGYVKFYKGLIECSFLIYETELKSNQKLKEKYLSHQKILNFICQQISVVYILKINLSNKLNNSIIFL